MRNLQFQDTFKMLRILKKAGVSRQARTMMAMAAESKDKLNIKELGMDFIFSVLESLGDAEDEVYAFFASLTGKELKAVKEMNLDEMVGMFEDFLSLPDLKNFFSKVFKLMK